MSMYVSNEHGESFSYGGHFWSLTLNLAEYYGWKPMGTRKPKGYGLFRRWPGNYDTNDGQTVVIWDAHRLGEIIAHSLTDPNFDENASVFETRMKEDLRERVDPELFKVFNLSFDKNAYREFGEFCSQGSFRID